MAITYRGIFFLAREFPFFRISEERKPVFICAFLNSICKSIFIQSLDNENCPVRTGVIHSSLEQMKEMLREAGFTDFTFETDDAYAGQGMVVCARKEKTASYLG